ncbi:hypothetical protein GCM10008905_10090 [Clostridium malenominatum]|uniref:Nucleotidyltransferase n=1 Tax=Clostridium malenominatum TaxID=1539 RepID=A0ABP3U0T9_9CLOT
MEFQGRKELLKALVGSHNYNLNTIDSDRDYKIFVSPTFEDLYYNRQFSMSQIGKLEDFDIHDIRKLPGLWWKGNINFLEILFSIEINIDSSLINHIISMKDDIAKMNLSSLYDACIGSHINKKKLIHRGTEGTIHLVHKYGYNTKEAMHSIRVLDFLRRFGESSFNDFKKALWYDDNDSMKKTLMDIKNGCYTEEEYYKLAEEILNSAKTYEKFYKEQSYNEELYDMLKKLVKTIVKTTLVLN